MKKFTYSRSPKMRIVSAFMAVLIFSLGFMQMLGQFDWGIRVQAYPPEGNGKILQVQTYSKYMGQSGYTTSYDSGGSANGTYTGKILPQSVNMYDYLTDYEKNNNKWNKLSDNQSNYTYYSRYEPYKQLNRAISAESTPRRVISSHENNITIKYISDIALDSVSVILKDPSNSDSAYSAGEVMTANAGKTEFKYTFKVSDLGFVGTTARLVFSDTTTNLSTLDQTGYYLINLTPDSTYTFRNYSEGTANKVTITYSNDDTWSSYPVDHIHYWGGTASSGSWPGKTIPSTSEPISSRSGNTYSVTFTNNFPGSFIFHEYNKPQLDGWRWQTYDINRAVVSGHNYDFYQGDQHNNKYFYVHYAVYPDASNPTSPAEDITGADMPKLYQGYFLASNQDSDGPDNNDPASYTNDRKPENRDNGIISANQKYTDFYWQANMAQRPVDNDQELPKASVTKMVDDELNDDDLVAQGTTALPYFDSSWSGVSSGLMKCWEGTADKSISFPFYEVLTNAKDAAGGDSSTTQKATFYQFNSKDSTLHFEYNNSTPQNSYFEERQPAQVDSNGYLSGSLNESIRAANGKVGFFPFNDGKAGSTTGEGDSKTDGSDSGYKNNYGFGAKFEMTFKLSADGKTSATHDSSGNKLASNVTPTKVNTRFEFNGDDDLWVFIDGNLVLDMGGAHSASYGYIDFAQKEARATNAIEFNPSLSSEQELNQNGKSGITELSESTGFLDKIDQSTTGPNGGYNPNTLHTMTIFYMERGMSESNLFIRFNFAAESNYNKLKVKEQTDFSGVNAGLKDLTKIAADTDVFKYKIENKDTNPDYVLQINTPYPTLENYVRQITSDQTNKTKLASTSGSSPDHHYFDANTVTNPANQSDGFQLVKNTNYNWVDEYALNSNNEKMDSSKLVSGETDSNGFMYLMYGTTADDNADGKERKSSGEFEDQFTRYSMMRITQQTDLRTPNRHGVESSDAAALLTSTTTPARTTTDYYNLKESYIFSTTHLAHVPIASGQQFNFRNTIDEEHPEVGDNSSNKDTDEALKSKVSMTAQFVNEPKVGAITVTKAKADGDDASITSGKTFKIKVRFEDIFGIGDVDADDEDDYKNVKYKVYNSSGSQVGTEQTMEKATVKVNVSGSYVDKACGTISLTVGQTATIEGIPVKTKYYIYEDEPKYKPDPLDSNGVISSGTVVEGEIKDTPSASPKSQSPTGVSGAYENNANNATVKNYSNTLTIKEVTDFSTVNSGLLTYTKKAAENDVFKYTVKNNSTEDGINSGITTPTYDTYTRQANGADTAVKLSGQTVQYVMVNDTDHIYLDVSQIISDGKCWGDDGPFFAAELINGTEKVVVEFEHVYGKLYRIDPGNYTEMVVLRLHPNIKTDHGDDWRAYIRSYRPPPKQDRLYLWGRLDVGTVTKGTTYIPTGWNSDNLLNESGHTDFRTDDTPQQIKTTIAYDYNNFVYDSSDANHYVKNVNYLWTDQFATHTPGEANDSLAGTTGNEGDFYLMFGEDSANDNSDDTYISSATFYNQFARGSTMTVEQGDKLTSPVGGSSIDTLQANNKRGADTSLEDYYTTTRKTLEGSYTTQPAASGTLDEAVNSFEFDNTTRDTGKSIRITETFTNTVKTGSITISKKVSGDESYNDTFQFRIILTDVFGVTGNNVENNGYGEITITNAFDANGTTAGKLAADGTFYVKQGIDAVISGIPVETTYQIVETTKSGWSASYKIGDSGSFNSGASTPASGNKISSNGITVSFINTPPAPSTNEIILTKTAKEQVGTTKIGDTLAGAKFKLVNVNAPTTDIKLKITTPDPAGAISGTTTKEYTVSTAGTYNISSNWIETGGDGRLHIKGLAPGDYYLEEQTAPAGFVATDSNNSNAKKKVYFSVGDNTTTKYLTCSDEMAPAYIKLYEHINERNETAWGKPTFIFKITQTHYYSNSTLTALASQRTHIVALTVDDEYTRTEGLTSHTSPDYDYNQWFEENTAEAEYAGMYHINSEGKIRLEPGTYQITRVPVSRYEFVENTWKLDTENDTVYTGANRTTTEALTVTIPASRTAIVHYYDVVDYYDKFTHVDTKINKFYQLNETTKANETVKGLIVRYDGKAGTSNASIDISTDANFKAKLIYVDGSERDLSDKTNITIDANNSHADITVTDGKIITVANPSSHSNKVYTLKAKYNNKFETTFELVFERTP